MKESVEVISEDGNLLAELTFEPVDILTNGIWCPTCSLPSAFEILISYNDETLYPHVFCNVCEEFPQGSIEDFVNEMVGDDRSAGS